MLNEYYISKTKKNCLHLIHVYGESNDELALYPHEDVYIISCQYSIMSTMPNLKIHTINRDGKCPMHRSPYYTGHKGMKFDRIDNSTALKIIQGIQKFIEVISKAIGQINICTDNNKYYKNISNPCVEIIRKNTGNRYDAIMVDKNLGYIESRNQPGFLIDENWLCISENSFTEIFQMSRDIISEYYNILSDLYSLKETHL